MIGQTLGPYQVLSKLGEGGMGEVYRARDTKLDRDVAIKVLPESFAADPDRLMRFEREAKTLASLNHPNIAAIYGIEESESRSPGVPESRSPEVQASGITRALVMELVEGQDLSEIIAGGAKAHALHTPQSDRKARASAPPISLDEALTIARQIAEALEAAHDAGIIHRDLKPANIKVKADGTVKVLDFGLAKALDPNTTRPGDNAATGNLGLGTYGPTDLTVTSPALTQLGVVLGTAAYMSPEQARGKPVDRRADIWAFGVVLYEMVTGRRLFGGEDLTETLAMVVRDQPDLGAAPARLRPLLARCLEKDPAKRLRDIGDVWLLLREDEAAASADSPPAARRAWPWVAASVVFALTTALALLWPRAEPAAPLPVQFEVPPPPNAAMLNPERTTALSPDGRYVVFAAGVDGQPESVSLWLRDLTSAEVRLLPGTERADGPFWSPDSRSIAFSVGRQLKRIELEAGNERTICATCGSRFPGSWNDDGTILIGGGSLVRVPAAGGDPEPVITTRTYDLSPQFLPDGRRFLYFIETDDPATTGVYASSLDDPATRVLVLATDRMAAYAPARTGGGWLLFVREQTLFAQPYDVGRMRLEGEPVVLVDDINLEGTEDRGEAFPGFWISGSGGLAYRTGTRQVGGNLTWFDRQGQPVGTVGVTGNYGELMLSPDGSQLATFEGGVTGPGTTDEGVLWQFDVARGSRTRLHTGKGGDGSYPVWSPDGREILFTTREGVIRKNVGFAEGSRLFLPRDQASGPLDWSPDGRFALLSFIDRSGSTAGDASRDALNYNIKVVSMTSDGATPTDYLATRFNEGGARFSPDGRWVVYMSNVSGTQEIYVSPFPDASAAPAVMISTAGGSQPRWRRDGRAIFYLGPDSRLMEAPVTLGTGSTLRAGTPTALFALSYSYQALGTWYWDVTPDGQRFVSLVPLPQDVGPLTVVLNWESRLHGNGERR